MLFHFSERSGVSMEEILDIGTALAPTQNRKYFSLSLCKILYCILQSPDDVQIIRSMVYDSINNSFLLLLIYLVKLQVFSNLPITFIPLSFKHQITKFYTFCGCLPKSRRFRSNSSSFQILPSRFSAPYKNNLSDLSICSFCLDNFIIQYSIPPAASASNPQRSHRVALLLRSSHHLLPYCLHKITFLEYIEYTSPEIHLIR